jgi:hypothetical protein
MAQAGGVSDETFACDRESDAPLPIRTRMWSHVIGSHAQD